MLIKHMPSEVLDRMIKRDEAKREQCTDSEQYFHLVNWIREMRQEKARRTGLCQGVYTYAGKFGIESYIHCEQSGKRYQSPNGRVGCYSEKHVKPYMAPVEEVRNV